MKKNISRQARVESASNVKRANSRQDIDTLNNAEREIRASRDYVGAILQTARAPLLVLRADLTIDSANDAFYKSFERTPDVTEGRSIFDLLERQRDIPRLRRQLEEIIPRNGFFNDFKMTREFSNLGRRVLIFNARRLDVPVDGSQRILLGIEDVTERQLLDFDRFRQFESTPARAHGGLGLRLWRSRAIWWSCTAEQSV